MQLTDSVTVQQVQERLGVGQDEELRESEKRRRYLEKFSRIITPERPKLRLAAGHPTASCNQEGDQPVIHMTTRKFDQPQTDFSRKIYDLIMQEALTVHEIGHVLYTDHDSFKSYLGKVDVSRKAMYKNVWNILEDGAIEKQLRHRFRVSDELEVLNRNLMEKDSPGHQVDDDIERFSMFQAVQLGLMDMVLWPTGKFGKLLDPSDDDMTLASEADRELLLDFVPEMKSVCKDVLSTPVSEDRNQRIYDFWEDLADLLDESEVDGQNESSLSDLIGDDGSVGGSSDESGDQDGNDADASPMDGKPDDTEGNFDGDARPASELGRGDVQEEVVVQVEVGSGENPEDIDVDASDLDVVGVQQGQQGPERDESGSESASGSDDGQDDGQDSDAADGGMSGERQEEIEESFRDELAQEVSELDGGEAMVDEAEEYLDIIQNGAGDQYHGFTMEIPEVPKSDFDRERWNDAQRVSKILEKDFRNRLIHERRSRVKRGKRRGKFDRGRMVHAARGSTRVFKKEEEGDEKDYSCIVVLDRSGSMSGNDVQQAEIAVGALAQALDGVGVETSILDLYNSEARLVKPFEQDLGAVKEHVVNGAAGGGTPLTPVLHLARERVTDHENPFMIVVTDGRPGNTETYREELEKCSFPVLGVYVEDGFGGSDEKYFHRQVKVDDPEEIETKLHNLSREVMF